MKKNGKEYQLMSIDKVVKMLQDSDTKFNKMLVRERFAMNIDMGASNATASLINLMRTPFQINDHRIMRLLEGHARSEVNFQEYELEAGDIVLVKEGSYFEVHEISQDARGEVIAFMPDKYQPNLSYMSQNSFKLHPTQEEWNEITRMFEMIYSAASVEPYRKDVVEPMTVALFNNLIGLSNQKRGKVILSSAEQLFDRFIEELNSTASCKAPVSHYAEKLCVTPQYLSRVVSQVSGKTVSQWINKAVITQSRILLRNPSKTVSDIAETLGFPNDSFFCRFFKRETGMTPTAYRKISLR